MEKAIEIYEVLTNKQYVRCKLQEGDFKEAVLILLKTAVGNQKPIIIDIGFGYHKNPNACECLLPDIAEEVAIKRLVELAGKVGEVYSHGMKVKIITSGRRAEIVNQMKPENTLAYHSALQDMVKRNDWHGIVEIIPLGNLYDEFQKEFQEALKEVKKSIQPDWSDPFWQAQAEHARRNIRKDGLTEKEILERSQGAAYEYVVYHRAEIEAGLLNRKFPGSIRASYNKHEDALIFWTTAKGDVTQPWQGKGVEINGRIEVITQSRKK